MHSAQASAKIIGGTGIPPDAASVAHADHCGLALLLQAPRGSERNMATRELTAAAVDIVMAKDSGSTEDETESAEDAVIIELLEDDTDGSTLHTIADEVGQIFGYSGRKIRERVTEFAKKKTFSLNLRGKTSPMHLLDDEDMKRRVTSLGTEEAHVQGREALTIHKFQQRVNGTLLKDLTDNPKYQNILTKNA